MRSMTGFGAAEATVDGVRATVELRSVNHRFFELRTRVEGGAGFLHLAEEPLRARLRRGRVDATVRVDADTVGIDRAALGRVVSELRGLRDELAPGEALPWALAVAWVERSGRESRPSDAQKGAVDRALDAALTALDAERRREGEALRVELLRLLATLRDEVDAVDRALPAVVTRHRERVTRRFRELAEALAAPLPPERIELEIALLAERMDVTEELARARTHLEAFSAHLDAHEPVGRTLDFLAQELLRETNTLGSKIADADVTQRVVAMKTTLERLKEQIQNVL